MKINYGRTLTPAEETAVNQIAFECGILFDTARLLFYRDINTVEKAKKFLSPGKKWFYSPFLFKDMENVVNRLKVAKENGETVLVYGDYDADGVCSTSILYKVLTDFGINTLCTIPEREEGYGINLDKIEEFCSNNIVDLIVTVDCGISERQKISELLDIGIDVIVTDHHEPPELLPDCLIINPKVKGTGYPFEGLCGAGVAFKLASALIGEKANDYLDFVALATVADSMDLIDENRSLVHEGLKLFNSKNIRTAFKYLINENTKQITAQTLAFNIAPRINAGGRMGDANASLRLFLASNINEIYDLAVKLNEYNIARQSLCDDIYRQAKKIIKRDKLDEKSVILVGDEAWNTGVIGIVAAKLVEEYNKPVVVFAGLDGIFKGSARSTDDINIYNAISSASDLLIDFGGHSQAAGISLRKENFQLFYDKLLEYFIKENAVLYAEKSINVDWIIDNKFSLDFAREINSLEPFGIGNKKPIFAIEVASVFATPLKLDSPHYIIKLEQLEILDFNGEINTFALSLPIEKVVIFEPSYYVYKDKEQVRGTLKKIIIKEEDNDLSNYLFRCNILKYVNLFAENKVEVFKSDSIKSQYFNQCKSLSVDRDAFTNVFNTLLSLENKKFINSLDYVSNNEVLNDKQFIFCTEVFIELGIFYVQNGVLFRDKKLKNPLTNSNIYNRICSIKEEL